jgi:HD-like signal output (HDOD) protein
MSNNASNDLRTVDDLLEQNIQMIDIPPRPTIIDRIRSAMNEEVPNFKFVGQLVNADVSLAAGLIKTANSPYFGYQSRARSVNEALMILGLDVTCRAIATISLRQAFPNSAHYERFWDASARIAALSGWLVRHVRRPKLRPDDAYTYGLFRDCGIVILLRRFPHYKDTLARANYDAELAFTAVEQQDFPSDHATIGCLLAQNWWLSDDICQAIRYHHNRSAIELFESGLPLLSRYLVAISQLAEHLLQKVSGESHTEEWTKLGPSCLQLLNLEEADLPELYEKASLLLIAVD